MKKFAKLLAMVLAVSMVLTMFVGAYKDTESVTKEQAAAINAVYNWGIMEGYGDDTFRPNDPVQRDQMAKIMYTLKKVGNEPNSIYGSFAGSFADSAKLPGWSKAFIGYAAVEGIFVGNDKNEFNATAGVTYIEAAIVMLRALGEDDVTINADGEEVSEYTGAKWYENAVKDALDLDLFKNVKAENLRTAATRADIAVMIQNAVAKAAPGTFELATLYTGVVVDITKEVEEDGEKVKYFVVDGAKDYAIGDLDAAEYLGKEVSWFEEGDDVSELTVLATGVDTVALSEIKLDEKGEKLSIGAAEFKYADVKDLPAYVFIETETALTKKTTIGALVEAAKADDAQWQEITVVFNSKSISVFDAGIAFVLFNEKSVSSSAAYDADTKTWNYSYTYAGYEITKEMSELEDNTLLAVKVIDNKVELVEAQPTLVSFKDLAVKSTKDGYVYTVGGEALTIYDADILGYSNTIVEADLYANQGKKSIEEGGKEYNLYLIVYEDLIIGTYEEVEAVKVPAVYGIVVDWTIAPAKIKDKDDKDANVNLAYVAVVINGKTETVKVVLDDGETMSTGLFKIAANANFAEEEAIVSLTKQTKGTGAGTYGTLKITSYKLSEDGKNITFNGVTQAVKNITFIDMSGNGYGAADYAIADNGVVSIGGKTTAPNSALYVRIGAGDDVAFIIVYDEEGKFGAYGELAK